MIQPQKFALLLLLVMAFTAASAQRVQVSQASSAVKGEKMEGYEVALEGTSAEVTASLSKYLKSIGKVKQGGDGITVNEPTLQGVNYGSPVVALTKENGKLTTAWIGMGGELPAEQRADVNKQLEKLTYDFGVQFYRNKIQVQVDESTRASLAVDKQQQRLINEGKNLTIKLEDNKREKIQLEKSIENNRIENEMLLKKIEKNKHQQDSIATASEQVKKAVEMHKDKQRKVN